MNILQLKRLLWIMNELLMATPCGGITRADLSDRWEKSGKNDYPVNNRQLNERTFHRIKDELTELFSCDIKCDYSSKKYSVVIDEEILKTDYSQLSLLDLLLQKEREPKRNSDINQIIQLLSVGNGIPVDDMRAARDLSIAFDRLPRTFAENFLSEVKSKNVVGADKAEEDEYYPNYVCLWKQEVYERTWQWLSIGFYHNEVCFYIVTNEPSVRDRERKAEEVGADEGIKYRGGYYWHNLSDKTLFSMKFEDTPDMAEVRHRAEVILERLAKVSVKRKEVL